VGERVLRARRELRQGPHPLGWALGLAASTVYAILARHGQSRLRPRLAPEPIVRYERARAGELLHVDIKPLARIVRRRDAGSGQLRGKKGRAGWTYLFVAIDDASRLGYARFYPDETCASALAFLAACSRFYAQHGITLERVLTDNGKSFKRQWQQGCAQLAIQPRRTRIRRPQTNGKAERFIRTLLEGWAYAYPLPRRPRACQRLSPLPRLLQSLPPPPRPRRANAAPARQRPPWDQHLRFPTSANLWFANPPS
jgi:transposase InsO family protein